MKTKLQVKIFKFSENTDHTDLLSLDEVERAQKFIKAIDRKNFAIGRSILRTELGKYLNLAPKDIIFKYTSAGKPFHDLVSFNISHSSDYFVLVMTEKSIELGIDVEKIDLKRNTDQLAKKVFHPEELKDYWQLDEKLRVNYFFQYWTLKEAILKATGSGLLHPMDEMLLQKKDNRFLYSNYFAAQCVIDDVSLSLAASVPFDYELTSVG